MSQGSTETDTVTDIDTDTDKDTVTDTAGSQLLSKTFDIFIYHIVSKVSAAKVVKKFTDNWGWQGRS